jgi:acyl-CoA synthetase (AMP-forming)/AMP-acid ligase II
VSDQVLETVGRVVNPSHVFTPYGATEALPVTLLSAAQRTTATLVAALSGEQGTLVGKPVMGVEVAILPHESGGNSGTSVKELRLPPRVIGDIVVRGVHVSPSYLHRPDAVQRSKIVEGTGQWHRMGDVGYMDDEGNLYFCGRAAHIVGVDGVLKYSIPVEKIFNTHSAVRRSALVLCESSEGPSAGIVVEPYPEFFPNDSIQESKFAAELGALGACSPLTADIQHFFFHRSFPVDGRHNAKIFRDKLGEWASVELSKKSRVVNS